MTKTALLATAALLLAAPAFAQTNGSCPSAGSSAVSTPAQVHFDLGSAVLKPEAKPVIAKAAETAKARQSVKVCLIGWTDKLGSKNYNEKLAQSRAQAVAAELARNGYPAKNIIIALNREAFGDVTFGSRDSQEKDRRVEIVFR